METNQIGVGMLSFILSLYDQLVRTLFSMTQFWMVIGGGFFHWVTNGCLFKKKKKKSDNGKIETEVALLREGM